MVIASFNHKDISIFGYGTNTLTLQITHANDPFLNHSLGKDFTTLFQESALLNSLSKLHGITHKMLIERLSKPYFESECHFNL